LLRKTIPEHRRIFVCHAAHDRSWAEWISDYLLGHGFDVWRDDVAIPAGESWLVSIGQALRQSNVMIAVMSPAFFKSEWAQTETASAAAMKMPIIPVMVEQCEIKGLLSFINCADLTKDRDAGMLRVVEAARQLGAQSGE
jgi:hypothetical protein